MTEQTVLYETRENGIGVVTLNRPKRANAMNQELLAELDALCARLAADEELRCVVVTGAGQAFSSGFDLKAQAEAAPQGVADWVRLLEADFKGIMAFWNLPVPTIAAVNGPCLAGGFEMMMACDLAVAAETAVFGEPELKFGAGIVAMLLPWYVGPKIAREIIYTAEDKIPADEARRLGLVNRLVSPDQVMPEALELAGRLARMDSMVMRRTKLAMNRSYEMMGMQAALRTSLDIDIMLEGEGSQLKRNFLRIVREDGMREALRWRDNRFDDAAS